MKRILLVAVPCLALAFFGVMRAQNISPNAAISTQTNATASRALATVYRNTGSTPIYVSVLLTDSGPFSCGAAYTDSANPPVTEVSGGCTTFATSVNFIVLPGNYYEVANSGGNNAWTLSTWIEWK